MPELPEVETIVRDLRRKVLGRTFLDVWTDFSKIVKRPKSFEQFKKEIKGKKIEKVWRRGKNIILNLSNNKTLLIHQKMTGHLLLGKWQKINKNWRPIKKGPLEDPMNRFLHLIFWLDSGQMLALSDLRKFAKVELWDTGELEKSEGFQNLGPEPLRKTFTFERFKETFRKKQGKIKQVLMDQNIIAGIGNIYSDEILFEAKIHPLREVSKLAEKELKDIYRAIKKILLLAVKLRGESIANFRTLSGEKGFFDKTRKVYRREGEKCPRCGILLKRIKVGGRSACFCPRCQKRQRE